MGLFDIFLSPEKQIEKENQLLAKPDHSVAEVVAYNEYDREESYENDEGQTEWRTVREAIVSFRFMADGEWVEVDYGPSQGYTGFRLGQQLIVKHSKGHITRYKRTLHKDSPNRI